MCKILMLKFCIYFLKSIKKADMHTCFLFHRTVRTKRSGGNLYNSSGNQIKNFIIKLNVFICFIHISLFKNHRNHPYTLTKTIHMLFNDYLYVTYETEKSRDYPSTCKEAYTHLSFG